MREKIKGMVEQAIGRVDQAVNNLRDRYTMMRASWDYERLKRNPELYAQQLAELQEHEDVARADGLGTDQFTNPNQPGNPTA